MKLHLRFCCARAAVTAVLVDALFTSAAYAVHAAAKGEEAPGFLRIPVYESKRQVDHLARRQDGADRDGAGDGDGDGDADGVVESIEAALTNQGFFYTVDLEIGTPGQPVSVLLDTGSSELWVNPDCDEVSTDSQRSQCRSFGRYDPSSSTTPATGPFGSKKMRYGDGSDPDSQTSAEVEYYADTVAIIGAGAAVGHDSSSSSSSSTEARRSSPPLRGPAPAVIRNQTFGVVVESHGQAQGMLGLAPDIHAGFDEEQAKEPYSLLLGNMVDEGLIGRRAFSLDLRPATAGGAIVFGGYDRRKFQGTLGAVPLVDGIRGEPRLAIRLTSITTTAPPIPDIDLAADSSGNLVDDSDSNHTHIHHELAPSSRNVMLDSGTTISHLHADAAMSILRALNARSLDGSFWAASCALRDVDPANGNIAFDLRGQDGQDGRNTTLRVPLSEFVLGVGPQGPVDDHDRRRRKRQDRGNGDGDGDDDDNYDDDDDDDDDNDDDNDDNSSSDDLCYVSLAVTSDQQVLGESFLRAGYFVFDWDDELVHVAQVASCSGDGDNDESGIVAVDADDGVPADVKGLCEATWDEAESFDSFDVASSPTSTADDADDAGTQTGPEAPGSASATDDSDSAAQPLAYLEIKWATPHIVTTPIIVGIVSWAFV